MRKIVITVAPLPQAFYEAECRFPSVEELAREIVDCRKAGASVAHLHVIDAQGNPTVDSSNFRRLVQLVHKECDIVIQGSTGGVSDLTRDERSVSVEVPGVEMASLNMGSCNIGEAAYINTPGDVEYWAEKMQAHGVAPDMTIFEPGMARMIERVLEKGLAAAPPLVNVGLGFPGGLPATPDAVVFMAQRLPPGAVWTLTTHHSPDFTPQALAVAMGANVRVGFEDSMFLAPGRKAKSNVELVERAAALIEILGRQVASASETRALYGLPRKPGGAAPGGRPC